MVNQFPLQGDIIFDAKPDAVPYNYRISYKVSQLCLIMYICGWGTSCSLIKLHMISFALLSRKNVTVKPPGVYKRPPPQRPGFEMAVRDSIRF